MAVYSNRALAVRHPCVTAAEPAAAACDAATRLREEIEALYEEHAPALIRYARAYSSDADAAGEAVQEAFLRYYMGRRSGETVRSPRAWLFRVVHNIACNQLRTALRADSVAESFPVVDPRPALDRTLTYEGIADRLPDILSGRELQCMKLRIEGLDYSDIGREMQVRTGTVATLLARAIAKVRRLLEPEEQS